MKTVNTFPHFDSIGWLFHHFDRLDVNSLLFEATGLDSRQVVVIDNGGT
jgi:hypothetical protein